MSEESDKETEIQWIKFGKVDSISFLGKDTIILGYGNYIVFVDTLKPDKKEIIYQATNDVRGDGVQCLCTHRCLQCFAFAEKCRYPRILINSFPTFETIKTIEAVAETNYVAIRFSEMEYLVTLTGLPNYTLVIWNWRTSEKLYSQDTHIQYPDQILRVSITSPIHIVQTNLMEKHLTIWEMNVCYKKALLNKNSITISQASRPPYAITWGSDGELYLVDSRGYLYSVSFENHDTNLQISWKGQEGNCKPCLCWYKNGLVIAGPNEVQFWRRKSPEGWARVWGYVPKVPLEALVSATLKESLMFWTETHELIAPKGEPNTECVTVKSYGNKFDFVCFIYPVGDYFITFGKEDGLLTVWKKVNGERVSTFSWSKGNEVTCISSNPKWPYIVASRCTGRVNILNLYDPTYPIELTECYLTKRSLDIIKFRKSGSQFCVATMDIGEFFLVRLHTDCKMDVVASIRIDFKIADFAILEEPGNVVKLVILPISQLCCKSGQAALVYTLSEKLKTFEHVKDLTMPSITLSILPGVSPSEIFCIPHRSRNMYVLNVAQGTVINQFASGHQMKLFSMTSVGNYLITYGVDGLLIVRSSSTLACVTVFPPHHRTSKGIKNSVMDPYRQYVITFGADGSLVCTMFLGKSPESSTRHENEALLKTAPYRNLLLNPIYAAKAKAKALEKLAQMQETEEISDEPKEEKEEEEEEEKEEEKTWLEIREEQKIAQEELMSRSDKESLYQDVLNLQQKVQELLDKNYTNAPEEQLPIHAFDLDKATRMQRIEEAKAEREKVQQMQLATIKARDKVSEYIIKTCWDTVQTKGRELLAIIAPISVQSYALLPDSQEEKMKLHWIEERIRFEKEFHRGDYFEPWVPRSDSMLELHLNNKFLTTEASVAQVIKTHFEEEEVDNKKLEGEEDERESPLVWTGTATHNFIKINPNHYSQFEITTYFQGWQEISIIEHDIKELMLWFNKQFEDMFAQKEREMANVYDRNNRFRHIIKELNFFQFSPEICKTVVIDPEWGIPEHPERIVKVEDNEIKVPMYISPSEQDLINKKEAEAERLRLLMLADDFRERALMAMMDGVLEKLWEDEIKKDVPKPKCMIDKDPETWTEEDLKTVKHYEEAVRVLHLERERYHKILEADWTKLMNTMKDSIHKFDDKVAKLHLLKLKVESAIGQEVLKSLRIRQRNFQRMEMDHKEEMIKVKLVKNEKKIESMQAELSKLQESLNECKNHYETLQNRDRNLDKNFKKDFPEYSPIICEQLYKLSKKRPRLAQKATMFATVLNDMGKCAVAGTKPDYLPAECIQYLKDIDGLDSHINAPAVVSEQSWELLCKLRRIKIESELKIRACTNDLAEAESTVSMYQKSLKAAKEYQVVLQNDLQTLRDEKLYRSQNFEIQLVLKEGLVEIPLTGKISDFDECIMVSKQVLNDINGIIKKVGMQKIKAMQKAANFRKGIIFKEWEHKKLRMEIEDLESKLATVEKIKVTKELQAILISRARGFSDEKGFLYLENELTGVKEKFEKTQMELFREIDEMNFKIDKVNSENEELDARITEINVEVNELNLERDKDFEKKQLATNMKRMKMVRERSKLVQKIQEQHNEILVLQTELELLRLRTFPTIKYKT